MNVIINDLPLLPVDGAVIEIAQVYVAHKMMPKDVAGDAIHLTLAAYYKCDFLLTWNCNHLANANKFGHIDRIHAMLGLASPRKDRLFGEKKPVGAR